MENSGNTLNSLGGKIVLVAAIVGLLIGAVMLLRGCSTPEALDAQEKFIDIAEDSGPVFKLWWTRVGKRVLKAIGGGISGVARKAVGADPLSDSGNSVPTTSPDGSNATPAPTMALVVDDAARAKALLSQAQNLWQAGDLGACSYVLNATIADPGLVEAQKLLGQCQAASAATDLLVSLPETAYQERVSASQAILAINPMVQAAKQALATAQAGQQYQAEWQVLEGWISEYSLDQTLQSQPDTAEITGMLAERRLRVEDEGGGLIFKKDTDPIRLGVIPDQAYNHLPTLHLYVSRKFLVDIQGEVPKRGVEFRLDVGLVRRPRTPEPFGVSFKQGDCVTGTQVPVFASASSPDLLMTISSFGGAVIAVQNGRVQVQNGAQSFWTNITRLRPCN